MNLADCQSEVLFLLQNLTLQGKFFIQNLGHSWIFTVALPLLLNEQAMFCSWPFIFNYKIAVEPA